MTDLRLRSPVFEDGDQIPDQFRYTTENSNPPLEITGVPDGTASLVLIVDNPDSDSPSKDVWNHWLVWDIPPSLESIPEAWNPEQAVQGQNDFAEHGYGGPNPTKREQTIRFRLYALNTTVGLPPSTTKTELADAVLGNIIDKAQLEGTTTP